jgi:hypothetical protein
MRGDQEERSVFWEVTVWVVVRKSCSYEGRGSIQGGDSMGCCEKKWFV